MSPFIRDESLQIQLTLDSGEVYQWRVDAIGRYVNGLETAGSESQWVPFLYVGE